MPELSLSAALEYFQITELVPRANNCETDELTRQRTHEVVSTDSESKGVAMTIYAM